MRNRRWLLAVFGAGVALFGSVSGAVGFLSSPQSAPIGVAVYKSHSASTYQYYSAPGGSSDYVSFYFDMRDGLAVGASLPPTVESKKSNYFSFSSGHCSYYHCSYNSYGGSFRDSSVSINPLTSSVRFRKHLPCGDIDVTFTWKGIPQIGLDQNVNPQYNPLIVEAGAHKNANAHAFGSACGASIDNPNAYVNGFLLAQITVNPNPLAAGAPGTPGPSQCGEVGPVSGTVHNGVEPVLGREPLHSVNCTQVVPWENEPQRQLAAWQQFLAQACSQPPFCIPLP